MDAELKAKWISALRGGEYQQCRGKLHDGVGYCCLGVLAKIAPAPFIKLAELDTIGWRGEEHYHIGEEERIKLEIMNDEGMGFQQIADYIEKNL